MGDEKLRDAMTSVEFAADPATPYHVASLITSVPLARVIMDLKARVEELEADAEDTADILRGMREMVEGLEADKLARDKADEDTMRALERHVDGNGG